MIKPIITNVIMFIPYTLSRPISFKQEIAKYLIEQVQNVFYEGLNNKLLQVEKELYVLEIALPSILGFITICFVLLFIRCFNGILIRIEKLEEDRN